MSEIVIQAKNLKKTYRLYSKPHYRFLDMLGLLRNKPGAYTEHAALDGINLEVRKGEKLGIIGRNGAGKSTLLKLATHVIEPTSGEIEVKGKFHALLQLGTGFHPDFTGRENVYSYLAHLGVSGKEADKKLVEIVDFAELEEYIDQPIKTYSSGMVVRLMFSTSTAISPDILVLDEVLGVGDAYFANKSYERIESLCANAGTTLLLVTHDVYSAMRIVNRVVWIEQGGIYMEGEPKRIIEAYEDSIRLQEEKRLRKKKQIKLREVATTNTNHLIVEIFSRNKTLQPCPVYFSSISLSDNGRELASLPLTANDAFEHTKGSHLQSEGTAWGEAMNWKGRDSRPMLNYGSPFHKIAGVLDLLDGLDTKALTGKLHLEYWSSEPCDLGVKCFWGQSAMDLGVLPESDGEWQTHTVPLSAKGQEVKQNYVAPASQGVGTIILKDLQMLDECGNEVVFVEHEAPISFVTDYEIRSPDVREHAQVILTFHLDGVQDVCRILCRSLFFDAEKLPTGRIRLRLPRMPLATGQYTVSIMIVKEDYFDREQHQFFSINLGVYSCLSRVLEIVVTGGGIVGNGTVFVGEGDWSLRGSGP